MVYNNFLKRFSIIFKKKNQKKRLHGSTPQFIHRDFKTSNLLVGENNTIKICDFGLSQIKKQGENISDGKGGAKGTPLWMAPEVLAGKEFNEKADVYRYLLFFIFDNFSYFRFFTIYSIFLKLFKILSFFK